MSSSVEQKAGTPQPPSTTQTPSVTTNNSTYRLPSDITLHHAA